jgi:glycosyltransferase involved in cell wall biosynthesis
MSEKRLLVISPTPSHPQNAGNRARIFRMLDFLKEDGWEIHFLLFDQEANPSHVEKPSDIPAMRAAWDQFWYLDRKLLRFPLLFRLAQRFPALNYSASGKTCKFFLYGICVLLSPFEEIIHIIKGKGRNPGETWTQYRKRKALYWKRLPRRILLHVESWIGLAGMLGKKLAPGLHAWLRNKFVRPDGRFLTDPAGDSTALVYQGEGVEPPDQIDYWYPKGLDRVIKYILNKSDYPVVLVQYVFMSKALFHFGSKTLKVIDTHDIFTGREEKFRKAGLATTFFTTTQEEEAKGLNRADRVIAIQEKESIFYRSICEAAVFTVGHRVEIHPDRPRESGKFRVLYLGPTNIANVDAIDYFLKEVWPLVIKELPACRLILAGNICSHVPDGIQGVEKLGEVPTLSDAYSQADVAINPVRIGTGLKIKNVEALGFGKPLVTTSYAVDGLEGMAEASVVTDDPVKFAEALIRILTDETEFDRLAKSGREYAANYNRLIEDRIRTLFQYAS